MRCGPAGFQRGLPHRRGGGALMASGPAIIVYYV